MEILRDDLWCASNEPWIYGARNHGAWIQAVTAEDCVEVQWPVSGGAAALAFFARTAVL